MATPAEVQVELSGTDAERLVMIGDDLEFLNSLPKNRLPTHAEVRLIGGILRRLLIDGQLDALWRPIAKKYRIQPTVRATEIDTALEKWPHRWVSYAWAGGATGSGGAHHAGVILASIPQSERKGYQSTEELLTQYPLPVTGEKRILTVNAWLGSTAVAIRTGEAGLITISRRSVLKYIANRKGGVHFDPRRDLAVPNQKKRLVEIEHSLLDHGLLRVGHLDGAEYEVVSMAHAVRSSDWAQNVVSTAKEASPSDFAGDPYELKIWTGRKEADGSGWATWRMSPASQSTPDSLGKANGA